MQYKGVLHGSHCNAKTTPWTCPDCKAKVFFFRCSHGSRVFFDDLGEPWPLHECSASSKAATGFGTSNAKAPQLRAAKPRKISSGYHGTPKGDTYKFVAAPKSSSKPEPLYKDMRRLPDLMAEEKRKQKQEKRSKSQSAQSDHQQAPKKQKSKPPKIVMRRTFVSDILIEETGYVQEIRVDGDPLSRFGRTLSQVGRKQLLRAVNDDGFLSVVFHSDNLTVDGKIQSLTFLIGRQAYRYVSLLVEDYITCRLRSKVLESNSQAVWICEEIIVEEQNPSSMSDQGEEVT